MQIGGRWLAARMTHTPLHCCHDCHCLLRRAAGASRCMLSELRQCRHLPLPSVVSVAAAPPATAVCAARADRQPQGGDVTPAPPVSAATLLAAVPALTFGIPPTVRMTESVAVDAAVPVSLPLLWRGRHGDGGGSGLLAIVAAAECWRWWRPWRRRRRRCRRCWARVDTTAASAAVCTSREKTATNSISRHRGRGREVSPGASPKSTGAHMKPTNGSSRRAQARFERVLSTKKKHPEIQRQDLQEEHEKNNRAQSCPNSACRISDVFFSGSTRMSSKRNFEKRDTTRDTEPSSTK